MTVISRRTTVISRRTTVISSRMTVLSSRTAVLLVVRLSTHVYGHVSSRVWLVFEGVDYQ